MVGLAIGVSRCALVSGLSSLDVDPGDAAITIDAKTDAPADAPIEATPPVTDAGCTCVPIPTGWTAVRFRSDRTASCPLGDSTDDVVLAPSSVTANNLPCSCTCTSSIDCANPTVTYLGGQNCAGGSKTSGPIQTNGTCLAGPSNAFGADSIGTLAKTATCTVSPSPFPTTVTGNGRLCTKTPSPCAANSGCNDPAGGFAACVVSAGNVPCPSDYPTRTSVAASVTEGRTCSGCACSADLVKCQLTIDAFTTGQCVTSVSTATTTLGVCANFVAHDFYKATTSVVGACMANAGTGSGAATAVQPRTVCCK